MLAPLAPLETDNSSEDLRIWAFLCPLLCTSYGEGCSFFLSSSLFLCKKKLSRRNEVFTRWGLSSTFLSGCSWLSISVYEVVIGEFWSWPEARFSYTGLVAFFLPSLLLGEFNSCCWKATRFAFTTLGMSSLLDIFRDKKRFWLRSRTCEDDAEGSRYLS